MTSYQLIFSKQGHCPFERKVNMKRSRVQLRQCRMIGSQSSVFFWEFLLLLKLYFSIHVMTGCIPWMNLCHYITLIFLKRLINHVGSWFSPILLNNETKFCVSCKQLVAPYQRKPCLLTFYMDAKTQYSIITYYYKTILIGKQKRIKQTKDRPKKKKTRL